MSGVNKFQRLTKIEFPLAFPHMMLGLNQTIVFALFMVIIGAFIGTEDLGQYILKALSDKKGAPFLSDNAFKMYWPKSSVPINAPMITINKANTIVWLRPSIICGKAKGNSIFVSLWNLFTPDIVAASCKPTGTLLKPSIVYLVAGIVA